MALVVAAAGPLLSTVDHWLNLPAERQFTYLHDEASAKAAPAENNLRSRIFLISYLLKTKTVPPFARLSAQA